MIRRALCAAITAIMVATYGASAFSNQPLQQKETAPSQTLSERATPLSTPYPKYPLALMGSGMSAEVFLRFTIDETGSVSDIQTVGDSHQEFRDAAIAAVKNWTYSPARNATGKQIKVIAEQQIVFKP